MREGVTFELAPRPPIPAGEVMVVGLAREGQAAAKLLVALGHRVVAVDAGRPDGTDTLADFGVEVHLNSAADEIAADAGFLVIGEEGSVGSPVAVAARERGLPVLTAFELGWRLLPNPFLAVTGGSAAQRSTLVGLLEQIHKDAELSVTTAGPKRPLCTLVENVDPVATIVCPVPAIEGGAFAPECGILLGGGEPATTMFDGQESGQFAVLAPGSGVEVGGRGRQYRVPDPDLESLGGSIAMSDPADKTLAVVAAQAAMLMGVDPHSISRTLATFGGGSRQGSI